MVKHFWTNNNRKMSPLLDQKDQGRELLPEPWKKAITERAVAEKLNLSVEERAQRKKRECELHPFSPPNLWPPADASKWPNSACSWLMSSIRVSFPKAKWRRVGCIWWCKWREFRTAMIFPKGLCPYPLFLIYVGSSADLYYKRWDLWKKKEKLRPTGEFEIVPCISSCWKGGLRSVAYLFCGADSTAISQLGCPSLYYKFLHVKSSNGYMYLLCFKKCERWIQVWMTYR